MVVRQMIALWAKIRDGILSDDQLEDKVYRDSWEMVPNDLRDYIKQAFQGEGFMIRKDMINNAVGYRMASITDPGPGSAA